MALATLRTGRPGRPPKDWLPFEEARVFARSLGLRSCKEWHVYHTRNELLRVPLNPHSVYRKHGFVSMYDWLNYEKPLPPRRGRRLGNFETELKLKKLRASALHVNSKGAHRVSRILSAKDFVDGGRIQLFPMPYESRVTFLYRFASGIKCENDFDESAKSDWVPLSIRVSAQEKASPRHLFGAPPRSSDHPLLCADLQREGFYIYPPGVTRPRSAFFPPAAHQEKYGVSPIDLATVLRAWWESDDAATMKKSTDFWLRESMGHKRRCQWVDWMLYVKHVLYTPLGVHLSFAHNSQQEAHNSLLSGVPVMHQVAARADSGTRMIRLDKTTHTDGGRQFVKRANIAFAICGVREAECDHLVGIFCFPRKTLLERGILGSETHAGRPGFSVFPPYFANGLSRIVKKSREAAEWQREFYIDLSDLSPEKTADAQNKLKEILSQNSSIFANN